MPSNPQKKNIDKQIDENLKRVYDDALHEPLPDRFTDLIAQLRSKGQDDSDDK
ncbi:hypothetical protein KUL25_08790 [Rhodobacteraceae bacterium N5(2021)]|uniref:Anti-sigma factor NepR domain-containing protein n=1 Tax=Gymnodinialimonas phycosphaerae TaxID=2841589 RepID=A0A975TYM5_9RHOB|nr:NepR family anti-sigma factor [Gymnodinialimonas phycosphaerae]MBY4892858.1 hypothetical protein [Gymnodinialimonas phycosphaerae]